MELTDEQRAVIEISVGRHLVLAPPGSGKTELLSRRILRALEQGVKPERMLCATFTNRAAFEMRDRVTSAAGRRALPDVGNLHHFCERFLRAVGFFHVGKHVVDEVDQLHMGHEIVEVLRAELKEGRAADLKTTHGVTVLAHVSGLTKERVDIMREEFEAFVAECRKNGDDPAAIVLAGVEVVHQGRIGIPRSLRLPWPVGANRLLAMGVLQPFEKTYQGLKRRFFALDFQDLLNETYLRLEREPLPDEKRFTWVQVDEVQDLNPLQWAIVRQLTAQEAVSVYFGDLEQAIFSFLGASLRRLHEATRDCVVHVFRTNFRSTPLLLEILMRYSLVQLESDRAFISTPADCTRANGEIQFEANGSDEILLAHVDHLLRAGIAHEVAILVHSNFLANKYAGMVGQLGWRTVKVSGFELGFYRPMRDFLAFVDLFVGASSRVAWTALVRRFGDGIHNFTQARYFVRGMFAAGWNPTMLFEQENPIPGIIPLSSGARFWAWRNRRTLLSLRKNLKPMFDQVLRFVDQRSSIREIFNVFAEGTLGTRCRYSLEDLLRGISSGESRQDPNRKDGNVLQNDSRQGSSPSGHVLQNVSCLDTPLSGHVLQNMPEKNRDFGEELARACVVARGRIEKFLRYADHVYENDARSLKTILTEDWCQLRRLKEADLLVGDERVIISTVHKAKGRQFDAVVVPDVDSYNRGEEGRRVLYVAISRAKRHLVLVGPESTAVLEGVRECFTTGYRGYYLRQAQGEDLASDWLFEWERLAALNAAYTCDLTWVKKGLTSRMTPVVRMAVKVLRHLGNEQERRRLLMEVLGRAPIDAVVDSLREIDCFDDEMVQMVRSCCLRSGHSRDWMSLLDYYDTGWKLVQITPEGTFRAEINEMGKPMRECDGSDHVLRSSVQDYRTLFEECLCACDGEVRMTAAEMLDENYGTKWSDSVFGATSDFDRLVDTPPHGIEDALRTILQRNDLSKTYESRLRRLLFEVVKHSSLSDSSTCGQ